MSIEKNKLVLQRGYGSQELLSDFCSGPFVSIDFNVGDALRALNDTLYWVPLSNVTLFCHEVIGRNIISISK